TVRPKGQRRVGDGERDENQSCSRPPGSSDRLERRVDSRSALHPKCRWPRRQGERGGPVNVRNPFEIPSRPRLCLELALRPPHRPSPGKDVSTGAMDLEGPPPPSNPVPPSPSHALSSMQLGDAILTAA